MQDTFRMLAIIPKSDKTIFGVYHDERCIFKRTISAEKNDAALEEEVLARKEQILIHLNEAGINLSKLDAVTAIGGLLRPVEGGTYLVNETMMRDLSNNYNGKHASNLGGIIAMHIADNLNIPAYIIDPPVVDELDDIARYSGYPAVERKSIFHALNQKAAARQAAATLELAYKKSNLIVAHIGNGISVGIHKQGKVIDVNNGLHGDGPFSLERAGSMPSSSLIEVCYNGSFTKDAIIRDLTFNSGLKGYLQVNDMLEMDHLLKENHSKAHQIIQAMGYQIAKEIGAMATVVSGNIDAIILTGEFTKISPLTDFIMEQVNWISDVLLYPGEAELQALNAGTLRVLRKEEQSKIYRE